MSRLVPLLTALVVAAIMVLPASAQDAPSGGIGLTIDDFEATYGPGEPGQSLTSFTMDDGSIVSIGLGDGVVHAIEIDLTGTVDGGLMTDDAEALAESFLPTDIEPNERYTTPGGPKQIAFRLDVVTWESDWLDDDILPNRDTIAGVFVYERAEVDGQLTEIATTIFLTVED